MNNHNQSQKSSEILKKIADHLIALKGKKPLVHHITNYVTVNECANMTLAIGASPVMADDMGEVEEMVSFASALVLNMGTLNSRTIEAMIIAGKKARSMNIPIIFDPVGIGATTLRTKTGQQIIAQVGPSVIRGNMSEVKMIAGLASSIKGVDSMDSEEDAQQVASNLSQKLGCVIAITGKQDVIAEGTTVHRIDNGHPILADVTGTGCMATSLIGCFCAATEDWCTGATAGIMTMGLAGELAQGSLQEHEGIGTFRARLFDAVWAMSPEQIIKYGKII